MGMEQQQSKLKQNMFTLVVITIAAAMIYGLPYFRSYYYDAYMATYHLTNTQMGTFGSMFGIFGAISYLFGGVVADVVSTRKVMSISLILTGVGGILHLMNPGYGMLLFIYAMWGFTSLFAFWPAVVKSLREISNENEQSKAVGFMDGGRGIVYAIDSICYVSIFAYFSAKISDAAGLRGIIIYYTAVNFILGILVFILLPEKKAEGYEKRDKISLAAVAKVIKIPGVWILSAILLCTYVMNMSFYYFTPYATSRFGMAATAGALVTVAAQYVRPIAAFGGGAIADKKGRSKLLYCTFSLMGICTLLMLVMGNMSSKTFVVLCILIYFGMFAAYNVVFSMMEEGGVPIDVAATATGLICTIGYLPEIIVPFFAGKLLDGYGEGGYKYLFITIVVLMVIGIVMLRVWDRYQKNMKK